MGVARLDTARRWSAVAAGTAAVVAAPVLWLGRPVDAPQVATSALLRSARASSSVAFSGFAETRGSLGLPDLPRLGSVAALLGSTTRERVWWRSAADWRVDTVHPTGEEATYAVRGLLHTWNYESRTSRLILNNPRVRLPRADDLLPPQAARRLLAGVDGTAVVRRLPARRVAGHATIGVRIVPGQTDSTIARADLWIEPRTGLPLALDLYSRGASDPALTSHFLDLRLGDPGATVLRPRNAASALELPTPIADIASALDTFVNSDLPGRLGAFRRSRDVVSLGGSATYGQGLARFVVLPLPGRLGFGALDAAEGGGGTVIVDTSLDRAVMVTTPLLTVVVAHHEVRGPDPTYLLVGTVTPASMRATLIDLIGTSSS
jgi:hypothetical protein